MRRFALFLSLATTIAVMSPAALALTAQSEPILARPHDLVLGPGGRFLFVADMNNDAVAVFDPRSLRLLGRFGEETLRVPHDVAFDSRGRLLVADSGNDRIAVFELKGIGGQMIGEIREGFASPEGADAPDGRLYVADQHNDVIKVLSPGRQVVAVIGRDGGHSRHPPLNRPEGVEVVPGALWMSDTYNDRVLRFDLNASP